VDTSGGVRLLGVGVSGLADWIQDDLFGEDDGHAEDVADQLTNEQLTDRAVERITRPRRFAPGMDVEHTEHGPGWVWGSGLGRVTVRFETRETGPGPVMTLLADDPALVARPRGRYPEQSPEDRPADEAPHVPPPAPGAGPAGITGGRT
jgi:DNA polymerase-4